MFFNSIDFALFLSIVFLVYWFVTQKYLKLQNVLIVVASYVFYGWWDWRFLSLILFSTLVDFSGYSDIAIGTSRLFGLNLKQNFAFPYFSRDIAEFWRRWHISLSTWFRDYLYIPLGGSRGGTWMKIRNTFIIFIVSGFWHGANWTFVMWGALHALYFMPLLLLKKNRVHTGIVAQGKYVPSVKELSQTGITFGLTVLAWIFFRAENMSHALQIIQDLIGGLISKNGYIQTISFLYWEVGFTVPLLMILFVVIEWLGREEQYALANLGVKWNRPLRYAIYYSLIIALALFSGDQQQFIYFQF